MRKIASDGKPTIAAAPQLSAEQLRLVVGGAGPDFEEPPTEGDPDDLLGGHR